MNSNFLDRFSKNTRIKLRDSPFAGSRVFFIQADGQIVMVKLKVAFRNLGTRLKMGVGGVIYYGLCGRRKPRDIKEYRAAYFRGFSGKCEHTFLFSSLFLTKIPRM